MEPVERVPLLSLVDMDNKDSSRDDKGSPVIDEVVRVSSEASRVADSELLLPERRLVAEKHLVRALDMRFLPTIILIFIMNYIDVSTSWLS